MLRLFVALAMSDGIRDRIAVMMGGLPGARWAAADTLHLTLRFVGEVDEGRASDIDAHLSRVRFDPFPLALSGVGVFGTGRAARTLWVGVEPSAALSSLRNRIETAVRSAGEPADGRAFAPHVTLARLNRPDTARLTAFLSGNGLFRAGPISIDRFLLMRSHLGGGAPIHETLREYPAVGGSDAPPGAG